VPLLHSIEVVVLSEKSVLPSVVVLMGKAVEPYIQVVGQEVVWAQIC
jgi:hypothetical protein